MNRHALLTLLAVCLALSSCVNREVGIFGRIPELYEQTASRQRALESLLSSGSEDDASAQRAMHAFMEGAEKMKRQVEWEGRLLKGTVVPISVSSSCGLHPGNGVIASVKPGMVTTVEIRIPLAQAPANGSTAYLCFTDEDGEAVAKSEAWYDAALKSLRIEVPFALNPDGKTVSQGAFDHYDRAMRIKLVSADEYFADSFEGETTGTLLTLADTIPSGKTVPLTDTAAEVLAVDSLEETEEVAAEEMAWKGPVLTARGIGEVHLGAALSSLPVSIPGVYDRRKLEKQYDEMEEEAMLTATFYLDGKAVMTALGDEQGNLVFLTVESPAIKVDIGGHYVGVGDPLQPLYKIKGVVEDETGAFAATYHGISIAPTPTGKVHAISIGAVW